MDNWKQQLQDLIRTGSPFGIEMTNPEFPTESDIDQALSLIQMGTEQEPTWMLGVVLDCLRKNLPSCLASTVIASVVGNVLMDDSIFKQVEAILAYLNIVEIYELTVALKEKWFGKGLGSRIQKLIARNIETWDSTSFKFFATSYPQELADLVRLTHPRLNGANGEIIRELLKDLA